MKSVEKLFKIGFSVLRSPICGFSVSFWIVSVDCSMVIKMKKYKLFLVSWTIHESMCDFVDNERLCAFFIHERCHITFSSSTSITSILGRVDNLLPEKRNTRFVSVFNRYSAFFLRHKTRDFGKIAFHERFRKFFVIKHRIDNLLSGFSKHIFRKIWVFRDIMRISEKFVIDIPIYKRQHIFSIGIPSIEFMTSIGK